MLKNIVGIVTALMSTLVFATTASAPGVTQVVVTSSELGFFGFIGGFVTGWTVVILTILLVLGIIAEYKEYTGWAVFFMIIAGIVTFYTFSFSWISIIIGVVAYLVIGLLWSFWRYRRHAKDVVLLHKNDPKHYKEFALKGLEPKAMLGTITSWIIIWPISFIESLIGDIINFVETLVTKVCRSVYYKIYESAYEELREWNDKY